MVRPKKNVASRDAESRTDHRHRNGDGANTAKAILDATRELLAEGGVRGLTVEKVAARSEVAKTTIYRRWRSKDELALAVLIDMVEEQVASVSQREDTRSELLAFVGGAVRILTSTLMGRVMQGLVSDLAGDPQLASAFRERVVRRRVDELGRLLARGIKRGDIRVDADIDLANELLFGPIYYRLLLSGKPLNQDLVRRVVDAFMSALGTGSTTPRAKSFGASSRVRTATTRRR
jgi:AcrR family transcriptional regulator